MKSSKGLFHQLKSTPVKTDNKISEEDFIKWTKEIFKGSKKNEKHWIVIGIDFAKGYRKERGDDEFYVFIKSFNIQCGEDTLNYIEQFVKEYETNRK